MRFSDLNLNNPLLNALDDLKLEHPTAIQEKVFSPIMSGRDVVGIAQTGTGKTFAYLLPLLRMWKFAKPKTPQILVIVPTRELVAQVVEEVEKLTTYMNAVVVGVYGGTNIRTQKASLAPGVDIVVGTPGRLYDLCLDGVLKTKKLKKLVIDEVDEMLHLGFRTQLKNIAAFLPEKRQNLMFSATLIPEVKEVISEFSVQYEQIEAAPSGAPLENIEQGYFQVPNFYTKANLLKLLLASDESMTKVLVFAKSKRMADTLYEFINLGIEEEERTIGIIHSSKSQNFRFRAVADFLNGNLRVLIATDLIARGVDIEGISHVINFDLPTGPEQYIHRIGRTGRAQNKGISLSFISKNETSNKEAIETLMKIEIDEIELPEELEINHELAPIEIEPDFVPFNNHKMKTHVPTGPAFHEKLEKNKKVNRKIRREEQLKMKYKKPRTRGAKNKKKK